MTGYMPGGSMTDQPDLDALLVRDDLMLSVADCLAIESMARNAAAAPWPAAAQLAAKFDLAARVLEATEQRDGRACWLRLVVTP